MSYGGYMAADNSDSNLLYTRCSECLNEGWLFCTLCSKYFCDDHACIHLSQQVNRDAMRDTVSDEMFSTPPGQNEDIPTILDEESKSFFRQLSETELRDKAEMELRSYFRRLLQEAKRVRTELERRMVYSTELLGGPAYRNRARASAGISGKPIEPITKLEREQKAQRATAKQQKAIREFLDMLDRQVKLRNITPAQLETLKQLGSK